MRKSMVMHTINFTLVKLLDYNYLAADLFQYICYWVLKNEEDKKNFHDGRYWTYFSASDLIEMEFKDLSKWTIQRAIGLLIEKKLLKVGNYNATGYDHTPWYSVDKEDIEFYHPNLIKLFAKKRRSKNAPTMVQDCTEPGADLSHRESENAPSTVQNCTDSIYTIDNNHTNNLANNQEKKDNIFLNSQHQQVDMVVSEVKGDSKGDSKGDAKSEHPLTQEQWKKYSKKMPQGKFDDTLAQDLKDRIDKYGEDMVDEYVDYVMRLWPEITYLPKFVEKVGEQLDLDASDARRNGKPFGKIKNEYRMRW